ncbi:hypothetical protein R5R35_000504 [Gryllus longicercus]|uniref:Cilia- and flagella-associated protein 45 n=1 Tax=Gryllus longicercus TaxID=2509291 RepID=A0AAN9VA04_9ORTH
MGELPQCTAVCPSYMLKLKREDKPLIAKIRRTGHLKGKAVVRLVNHDMIRDLLIPSGRPNRYPAVFPRSQFEEIKMKAKHLSIPEKIALLNEEEAKRKEEEKECMRRRVALQDFDIGRIATGPDIVGRECDKTAQQANYALARAYELRQEQDDDVKKFNSVILQTKCHAIREAQVAEKKLIEKQLKEEEKRLDDMMEQERRKAIHKADEERRREIEKKQEYVKRLLNQIRDKEISKLLEAENVECESRKMQESNIQMQLEELEKRKKQIALQEKVRKDLEEVNNQLKRFREMEKEDEKAYEIKMKELQKMKAEQEECRELRLKAQALSYNQAFAKCWCTQKKEHDMRDKLNDLHEQRIQDEIERSWRMKEQMAARKRFELNEKLKMGREAQIEDTRRMRALEMAREKQEYENVLRAQQEAARKEDEKEKKRQKESEIYLKALLNQIREKEQTKIRERQQVQEEGILMRLEANCHDRQIKTIVQKKVNQLRTQVPEVYVKQVERQLEKPNL